MAFPTGRGYFWSSLAPTAAGPSVAACRDPPRIRRAIDRVMEIVGGRTNRVMGTGAMPLETPPENIRLIREYIGA